jgi:hypothetical protein
LLPPSGEGLQCEGSDLYSAPMMKELLNALTAAA